MSVYELNVTGELADRDALRAAIALAFRLSTWSMVETQRFVSAWEVEDDGLHFLDLRSGLRGNACQLPMLALPLQVASLSRNWLKGHDYKSMPALHGSGHYGRGWRVTASDTEQQLHQRIVSVFPYRTYYAK